MSIKSRIIFFLIISLLIISTFAYGEKPIKERLFIGGAEGIYILKFDSLGKLKIENHIEKNIKVLTSLIEGNYLFVGEKNGISIYNVKNQKDVTLLSRFVSKVEDYSYPSSYPHKLFIERDRLYIPYGISGILILDIRNKKLPEKIGRYNNNTVFYDLVVKDRYIYASSDKGVIIINAKDPENLKKIQEFMSYKKKEKKIPIHLKLKEGYLIIGKRDSIYIYSIDNPESPVLIKKVKVADSMINFYLQDEYLFVIDDNGFTLRVFNINILKKKRKKEIKISINTKKIGIYKSNYPIEGLVYFRDFLYLSLGKYGVEIVSMENLEKITKKMGLNLYTDCLSISVGKRFAYAVDQKEGLLVIDKKEIVPINWHRTLKGAMDFYKAKKYGYFLQKGRLSTLSIKEDGEPYRIDSTWKVPDRAFRLYLANQRLYVASLDYGLFIYNLKKDPTFPKLIKKFATDGNLYDIYAEGDILYLADGKAGFFVIDAKDTENIKILRKYKTKNPLFSIFKYEDIVYLGEKDGTFEVISLENPKKIETIGSLKFTSPIIKIRKEKNYLFLAAGFSGVKILKIDSPYNVPHVITEIPTKGFVWDIDIEGDELWIADGENGVIVYNIEDINSPKLKKDIDWFSADSIEIK